MLKEISTHGGKNPMTTLDMKKSLTHLYNPSPKTVSVVDVPPLPYLMMDGAGDPNSAPRYMATLKTLYNLAYAIRGIYKEAGEVFTVMPLEGLWSFDGDVPEGFDLTQADKSRFVWTLMLLQPESVTAEQVEAARNIVRKKNPDSLVNEVRFEVYHEGEAVQIMHIGSYNDEGPNVARLHDHIISNGWRFGKRHHEIYLNDPRKVAPDKLKTVIRQPFER